MNLTTEVQSIREDLRKLLEKIDGNEYEKRQSTNSSTGEVLSIIRYRRRIPRERN